MNTVVLIGSLYGQPFPASTTAGASVATVHMLIPCECALTVSQPVCYEIPCIVPYQWLGELLRWKEQGFHVRLQGHLHRETLWYGETGGLCTVQVKAEALTCIDPETRKPVDAALLREIR